MKRYIGQGPGEQSLCPPRAGAWLGGMQKCSGFPSVGAVGKSGTDRKAVFFGFNGGFIAQS